MEQLFDFIASSPTAYHAAAHIASLLDGAGYRRLEEGSPWDLERGKGYYVVRNSSSLIAFRLPSGDSPCESVMAAAAHLDSPALKIKENAVLKGPGAYLRLSVERYGGMIYSSWFDRPLSIAGRVLVRNGGGVRTVLVDLAEPCALIPHVAIHMNRSVNDGYSYNPAVDLLPVWSLGGGEESLKEKVAEKAGCAPSDILASDLFLYNPARGYAWNGLISAPRLDDLECAYSVLEGFLSAKESRALPVALFYDNEEVGSTTKQGAASPFFADVLSRIAESLDFDPRTALASGLMLSCDNAHGVHPNHPEYADKNHTVTLNGGIVIKYNANQKYTSDAVSAALFRLICEEADVPVQIYTNRADIAGGSTLGNISNTQVALNTVDIGLAQLAMHSAFETAGENDTEFMVRAITRFFEKELRASGNGSYAFA